MPRGKQWIHFDAQFPLKFGHDIQGRFGAAGELLFILFLCACKRSYPQGQVHYRTEDEFRILVGAHFEFVDNSGDKWDLLAFWQWLGRRKVTSTRARGGRTYVTATRWDAWEDSHNASERERKRRSRAKSVTGQTPLRLEVGVRRLEVGGGSVRGDRRLDQPDSPHAATNGTEQLVQKLMHQKPKTKTDAGSDQ